MQKKSKLYCILFLLILMLIKLLDCLSFMIFVLLCFYIFYSYVILISVYYLYPQIRMQKSYDFTHPFFLSIYLPIFLPIRNNNGYMIYVDLLTGENCRQFSLLIWTSFVGQFVHPVEGEGMRFGRWTEDYFSQLQVLIYQSTWKSGAASK